MRAGCARPPRPAAARQVGGGDRSAVELGDQARDVKTKPEMRARPARRAPRSSTRKPRAHLVGQQGTLVGHRERGDAAVLLQSDAHGAPGRLKSTAFSTSLSRSCAARSGEPSTSRRPGGSSRTKADCGYAMRSPRRSRAPPPPHRSGCARRRSGSARGAKPRSCAPESAQASEALLGALDVAAESSPESSSGSRATSAPRRSACAARATGARPSTRGRHGARQGARAPRRSCAKGRRSRRPRSSRW